MKKYSQEAKRNNRIAAGLSLCLFIGAVVLIGFSSIFDLGYKGITQIVGIVLLTMSVMVLTRYIFKSFVYTVCEREAGEYDLEVAEIQGKSNITVCRISLRGIEDAVIKTKENARELRERARGRRVFSYCPDIAPENECWVFASECGEELVVKLCPDDVLLEILQNGINFYLFTK